MKRIQGWSGDYAARVMPIYLLSKARINDAVNSISKGLQSQPPPFTTVEEATCWAIAANARKHYRHFFMNYRHQGWEDVGLSRDVRTYMFGDPLAQNSRFKDWFSQAGDKNYRIIVSATHMGEKDKHGCYGYFLGPYSSDSPKLVRPLSRHLTARERTEGALFAQEFAQAMWSGNVSLEDLVGKTGHVFWSSHGMPPEQTQPLAPEYYI